MNMLTISKGAFIHQKHNMSIVTDDHNSHYSIKIDKLKLVEI